MPSMVWLQNKKCSETGRKQRYSDAERYQICLGTVPSSLLTCELHVFSKT